VIETLVRFAVFCLLMHGHRTERQQPQQRGEYGEGSAGGVCPNGVGQTPRGGYPHTVGAAL
jgi:hypothetical protein